MLDCSHSQQADYVSLVYLMRGAVNLRDFPSWRASIVHNINNDLRLAYHKAILGAHVETTDGSPNIHSIHRAPLWNSPLGVAPNDSTFGQQQGVCKCSHKREVNDVAGVNEELVLSLAVRAKHCMCTSRRM